MMNRRDVLKALAVGGVFGELPALGESALPEPVMTMETYVYKKTPDCEIKLDVYHKKGAKTPSPVIVSIHGGALIMGGRYSIPMDLFDPLIQRGFAVVSIDYRLAPETKLPEIIKDLQDAYRWVHEEGPKVFGGDPERIGVQGGSAGGYLTLMTGICVEPKPKALVSFYGYGDIIGKWYSAPDEFYSKQTPVGKEAAYSAVGQGVPCGFPQGPRRGDFYLYCRQNGLWPKEVSGLDPLKEPEKFKPYCPVQNVTKDYPPTLLAHGDKDTDVPYEESRMMDDALTKAGVEHEFITVKDAGHGFSHSKKEDYQAVVDRSIEFLTKYVAG